MPTLLPRSTHTHLTGACRYEVRKKKKGCVDEMAELIASKFTQKAPNQRVGRVQVRGRQPGQTAAARWAGWHACACSARCRLLRSPMRPVRPLARPAVRNCVLPVPRRVRARGGGAGWPAGRPGRAAGRQAPPRQVRHHRRRRCCCFVMRQPLRGQAARGVRQLTCPLPPPSSQALPRQPVGGGARGGAGGVDHRAGAHHRGHHRLWHGCAWPACLPACPPACWPACPPARRPAWPASFPCLGAGRTD